MLNRIAFTMALLGLVAAGAAEAQSTSELRLGAHVAAGAGPSPSAALGFGVDRSVFRGLTLGAELTRWGSGIGVGCSQGWPESYQCDVNGWAALAKVGAQGRAIGPVLPYAQALGGVFHRGGAAADPARSPTLGLEAGVGVPLSALRVNFGIRALRVRDGAYEDLMGEPLQYAVGMIGISSRIW